MENKDAVLAAYAAMDKRRKKECLALLIAMAKAHPERRINPPLRLVANNASN